VREAVEQDLPDVREIYNHYVANSTVTFDESPWTLKALRTKYAKVRELGYRDATDTSISVRWEVSTEPGTEVSCAIQALNGSFGIVGWRIIELGASERRTRVFEESLRTAEPAVTGLPYRCWLP